MKLLHWFRKMKLRSSMSSSAVTNDEAVSETDTLAITPSESASAEPLLTDKFGNPFKIHSEGDCSYKVTFPNREKFEFLGDVYSLEILLRIEDVKVYYQEKDSEAILRRDGYGRLFLYFYDEYMGFDEDRYDYLWTLVADEADADELVQVYRLSRLRTPYVAYDGGSWVGVHEWL
jgi:hypothetical protein